MKENIFPDILKYADVSPVYKKSDNLMKDNYRPISVLTSTSKIFESIMCDQMRVHFKTLLSIWLAAYRTKYSCNNVLLSFIEYLRECLDNNESAACILIDLSKAFDCLPHDLLLAKLSAYGLSESACKYIQSYLTDRKQRVKIQNVFSSWETTNIGVPQGSIAGPLLFNIFINDLFFYLDSDIKIFNYADDNTLVYSNKDMNTVISKLESATCQAIRWFDINKMKANPSKFQSLILNKSKHNTFFFNIQGSNITPDPSVKLLGVYFDDDLSFSTHVNELCKKVGKQINALRRVSKLLGTDTKMQIYNSFICSHFNYCPVVYNECSINLSRKLEKLQERALRFVYNDYYSSYQSLLKKANKPSLYLSRQRSVVIQVFKVLNDMALPMTSNHFSIKSMSYSLRDSCKMIIPKYNTITYGKNSFKYRGAQLWNEIPTDAKSAKHLDVFKECINQWSGPKCSCGSCFPCVLKQS